jgi:flagellar biosynthesis/type III secretory pathway protein FliH
MSLGKVRVVRADEQGHVIERLTAQAPTERSSARVVRSEVSEAMEQAHAILRQARAEAQAIGAEAHAHVQQQAEQARQIARTQAEAELSTQWAALRARAARADEAAMDRTIAIARLLAERILQQQLRMDPEMLIPMAREAVAQFWRSEAIAVHGCSHDIEVLRAHGEQLGAGSSVLSFEVDESCTAGTIRIRTAQGSLDADVAVQLDRLVEALRH